MSVKRPSDQEIKDFFDQHPDALTHIRMHHMESDVHMSVIAQRLSMTVKQLKNILMDRK